MVYQVMILLAVSAALLVQPFVPTQEIAQTSSQLQEQFRLESKEWPNLHAFLYVLARSRNGEKDSLRAAVRDAPSDLAGFDALSAAERKTWNDAVAVYQTNAAALDISYGKLVDVNYAVADLGSGQGIEEAHAIPIELRNALKMAEPVYRKVWWPRHDARNRAWILQLRPQIARYGPQIVQQLTSAFQHSWRTGPLRVEVVAYANWAGAFTTDDPPLITMSSLNEEHAGADGLEQLFHECSHLMMGTVDVSLGAHAKTLGKDLSRDVSHTILFYTVGEVVSRIVPGHVPYAVHYGVWQRGWTKNYDLLKLYWQPYLDGKATMDEAIDRLVRAI